MRTVILFFVGVLALSAADSVVLARLVEGTVTRDGQALAPGADVSGGQLLAVSGNTVARIDFVTPTQGTLLLLPQSEVSLSSEDDAGHADLIVHLQRGRLEAKLDALGSYASLQVRGAAISIRVTGTIFVVDRTRRDTDYVAMVLGKVSISLRRDIAALLNRSDPPVELVAGQGLSGNTQTGLGQPQSLSAVASISTFPKAVAGLGLVPEAGFAPGAGTGGVLDTGGGSGAGAPGTATSDSNTASPGAGAGAGAILVKDAEVPAGPSAPGVPGIAAFDPVLPQQVVEEVTRAVTDQITNRIVEEVTQQVIGTGLSELPTPPALPGN